MLHKWDLGLALVPPICECLDLGGFNTLMAVVGRVRCLSMRFAGQAGNPDQPVEYVGLKPLPSMCMTPGVGGKLLVYIPVIKWGF